jgi:hypothetical protein
MLYSRYYGMVAITELAHVITSLRNAFEWHSEAWGRDSSVSAWGV